MKTKALLLSAALGTAGSLTPLAQDGVFSINAVGYINLTLVEGFNLIANQLDNADGNTLANLLPDGPDGTQVFKWNGETGGFASTTYVGAFGGWTDPDVTLNPGEAAFVNVPGETRVTFVGEVPQGDDLAVPLGAGFSLVSSIVPQTLDLSQAEANFPAADGDQLFFWSTDTGGFASATFSELLGGWTGAPTTVEVGQGFFVNKEAAVDWERSFSIE